MLFISEQQAVAAMTIELACEAVRDAFIAAANGSGSVNPVVIAQGLQPEQTFSIKSGAARRQNIVGFKVGSYWGGNEAHGLPAHSSAIFLLDPATGALKAVIEGRGLNGVRTAAADAVAAAALARPESETLSVIGAGPQAFHEVIAICSVLKIRRVILAARSESRARDLARRLRHNIGTDIDIASVEVACRKADVLVTVTTACAPLFDGDWIRPGTHIASMGSDREGKQELPLSLLARARLFCDLPQQSLRLGEFQHIRHEVEAGAMRVTALGDVLSGGCPGREDPAEITVFDSSGIALQDLFVAARLLGSVPGPLPEK